MPEDEVIDNLAALASEAQKSSPEAEKPTDATAAAEPAGDTDLQEAETNKRKGVQRRIDELTEHRRSAERDRDYWRELAMGKAKPEAEAKPKADPDAPVKPKLNDFQDWNEYEAAKDDYTDKLTEYKAHKALEAYKQQTVQEQRASEWSAKEAKARETYPDYDEVVTDSLKYVSPAMAQVALGSDIGTDVAYYFGKNLAEAKRIFAMQDPLSQAREIGKLEARIAQEKSAESKEPDTPAQTRAPKPPTPIQKTSNTDMSLRDDLPYKEWLRRREASLRSK